MFSKNNDFFIHLAMFVFVIHLFTINYSQSYSLLLSPDLQTSSTDASIFFEGKSNLAECSYVPKDEHPSINVEGLVILDASSSKNDASKAKSASERECATEYNMLRNLQNVEANGNKEICEAIKKTDGVSCKHDDKTKKQDCALKGCTRIIVNNDGTAKTKEYPATSGSYTIISSAGLVSVSGIGSPQSDSKTLTAQELADLVKRVGTRIKTNPLPADVYWFCTQVASLDRTDYICG